MMSMIILHYVVLPPQVMNMGRENEGFLYAMIQQIPSATTVPCLKEEEERCIQTYRIASQEIVPVLASTVNEVPISIRSKQMRSSFRYHH
jgi:hypothetical protein